MAKRKKETVVKRPGEAPQTPTDHEAAPPPKPLTMAEAYESLRKRANAGDERSQAALMKYLDNHPDFQAMLGNLAVHAELTLIQAIAGGEWIVFQAIYQEANRMRSELAGQSPSPLEILAVERIVATWLHLQYTEMQFLKSQDAVEWAKYWLKRVEVADKIYRAAIKSLVLVREHLVTPKNSPHNVPTSQVPAEAETPVAMEKDLPSPGGGVNRVAALLARSNHLPYAHAERATNGKKKLNGHPRQRKLEPCEN